MNQPTWWDTYTRGTPVEYLHNASGKWLTAVIDGYRARDNAYVLVTAHGTDVASVDNVREQATS